MILLLYPATPSEMALRFNSIRREWTQPCGSVSVGGMLRAPGVDAQPENDTQFQTWVSFPATIFSGCEPRTISLITSMGTDSKNVANIVLIIFVVWTILDAGNVVWIGVVT